MTYLEKLKIEHPERVNEHIDYRGLRCPYNWGYVSDYCCPIDITPFTCKTCWNREMPEAENAKPRRKEEKIEELNTWCDNSKCEDCPIYKIIDEVCDFDSMPEEMIDELYEAIHAAEKKTEPEAHAIEVVAKATPIFESISKAESYTQAAMRYRHNGLAPDLQLFHGALGLAGESGEVCDLIKKYAFQGHPLDKAKLAEELGDTLWYLAHIAFTIGIPLAEIMDRNIAKLEARYPNGRFEVKRSINRKEAEK